MDKNSGSREVRVLGIDLGKNLLHLYGVGATGKVVFRKALKRVDVLPFLANLKPCLIGMEACAGAHYWGRKLKALGHEVKLMAPQLVKPYVKGNKNDFNDAEGICEAVQRSNMRFVAVKSEEQQEILGLHRARSLAVSHRTAQINQIRGLLLEFGMTIPMGAEHVRRDLPELLEEEENGLTSGVRELMRGLLEELRHLDERVEEYGKRIAEISRGSEACRLLMTMPGMGVLSASALVATVGDAKTFRDGRELAAWLGLVPRQHSTGGKPRLLGISKRGDVYVRTMLIHGARAVLRVVGKKQDGVSRWVRGVESRRGWCIAVTALAAKNVRMAWALLTKGETYHPASAG